MYKTVRTVTCPLIIIVKYFDFMVKFSSTKAMMPYFNISRMCEEKCYSSKMGNLNYDCHEIIFFIYVVVRTTYLNQH